ncbi:MAG: PfkB family carbohydrate kinase [Clostridiales bacterium]|nr:PfkB family carbohydrate kinase [Clostridiales bacterium]
MFAVTIREIAALANVSPSTVSKIMNKKSEDISEETRQRVLRIIKEYNYSPHAKFQPQASSFLLGVSVAIHPGHERLMTSIVSAARKEGYATIITTSACAEDEAKNLAILCSHHVDGIIWDKTADSGEENRLYLQKQDIPLQVIDAYRELDPAGGDAVSIDYSALGYAAALKLVELRHHRIGCVIRRNDYANACFQEGFRRCLFDHSIPFNDEMNQMLDGNAELPYHVLNGFTGVVCFDYDLASKLEKQAKSHNMTIPRDLSLISLNTEKPGANSLDISAIDVPFEDLGVQCVSRLVERIENRPQRSYPDMSCVLSNANSLDIPSSHRGKKILVVGSINMDNIIQFDRMPQMGETLTADNRVILPGGKGLNQAVAASKLGAEAYLIGRVGKDHDGRVLYDYLKTHGVNTEAVTNDPTAATGTAYIYVRSDGESSIVVYNGANQRIQAGDIDNFSSLFHNASYCLLQTEISADIVEYAARTARRHQAKVILKPCAVSELSDALLAHTNILMPNEMEVNRLLDKLGKDLSCEEMAQYFLDKGVETVIITLGARGCYLRDAARSRYFEAADVAVVDTTGAADAFAATLAVYLSNGHSMETAVLYATYAAGLSTTTRGVPTALTDQITLDFYVPGIEAESANANDYAKRGDNIEFSG